MDVKKFYEFVNENGLEYFHCNSCGSLYPHYKPKNFNCKYCQSSDVIGISEEEFYNYLEDKTNPDEFQDLLKHQQELKELDVKYPIRSPHYLTDERGVNWIAKD